MKLLQTAAAAIFFLCSNSFAALTVNINQVGPNVVATGSGTVDLTGLAFESSGFTFSRVQPNSAIIVAGDSSQNVSAYTGLAGPKSFGTGIQTLSSSNTGDVWAINGSGNRLVVPTGFVSGSALNFSSTWNATTLAGLGLTQGTYTWTWAGDFVTLNVGSVPFVTATKTVSGAFTPGSTATYTVVLNNAGALQPNNPGNEYTDVLPAGVTLVSAAATSGTAVANVGTNSVTWNGSIPAASTVTLTITTTVSPAAGGTVVSSQGSVSFDVDANGTNETTVQTDDPGVAGVANPTNFTVVALAPVAAASIPTLSEWGLILTSAMVGLFGLAWMRRRS